MGEKLYKNKEWMYEHYVEMEESMSIVAQKAGCSRLTIWRWLHELDIPARNNNEAVAVRESKQFCIYKDRAWLYHHYIILEESTYVVAQKAGCGDETIRKWLHKFDISARTCGEGIFLALRNYLDISPELLDVLSGELLGDGHIGMSGSRSALYRHTSKYREYLIWLSKTFANLGLEQAGKINKRWSKKGNAFSHYYTSRSYPELVSLRERWYPNGEKIVPKDLVLAPVMAKRWFLGDGGLYSRAGVRPQISFSTCSFDKASVDHLLGELRGKGFKVSHWPSNNSIGMSTHSVKDFLDWIGPSPIQCYDYKWNYQDNRKKLC